ncbi:hypothetical protein JTB14_030819 [Gonioctena quinquepunctata]|nr:hypothetical protein JTB14_030819 [Gonioctena quinquepunctata]
MDSKYSVPIVPQNLYKNETIVQIADVLEHLTNITDTIFSHINKRLESSTEKLSNISHRVDIVNKKINTLKGAKKATQVFSSSKYPANNVYKEYTSIFYDAVPMELKKHSVKLKNISSAHEPVDKLQFYHVNVKSSKESKLEGLGIADDLHYDDDDLGPGIAPSADIIRSIIDIENSDLPPISQNETELEKEDIPITNLPPLPPPPPVVELPKPPPEPQKPSDEVKEEPPKSLMEEIRNAGGKGKAKLKSVEKKGPPVKVNQGGDLMADLHNKLFMRRKGISGAKPPQENYADAESTLSRISAMIPPPEPRNEAESTSNDEDWEE